MPYLEIPILNPINAVDKNRELPSNYHMKHFDAWLASEQILPFEQYKCDVQKWQFDDICFLQIQSDITPVKIKVRNSKGLVVLTQIMSIVSTIGSKVYQQAQIAFDDPVFDEGYYFCEILAGDPVIISTELTVWHVKETHENTILLKYRNLFNNQVLWETGIYMTFRVDGVMVYEGPESVRTVYVDQPGSQVTVKGDAFRKYKFYVGTEGGLSPWKIDKIEEIINQNNVDYDGKPFSPIIGAKWSTKKLERYPWAQWNIEMREVVNRRSKIFESDGLQEQKVAIDYIVEGRLFGPIAGSANDNTYTINEIG